MVIAVPVKYSVLMFLPSPQLLSLITSEPQEEYCLPEKLSQITQAQLFFESSNSSLYPFKKVNIYQYPA